MSRLLALIGALLVVGGAFLLYARAEVFDADALGARAAAALADDADLRLALAPTIAGAIAEVSPANAPAAEQVDVALQDPRVEAGFAAATAAVIPEILGSGEPVLDLSGVAATAAEVTAGTPAARLLTADALESAQLRLSGVDAALDALSAAEGAAGLGPILAVAGVLLLIAAVALAPGLLRGLSRSGVALAFAAALGAGALLVGRVLVARQFDDELTREAVEAAWDGLLGDLLLIMAVAAGVAVVVAFLAGSAAAARDP